MNIAFLTPMSPAVGPTERLWVAAASILRRKGCHVGASVIESTEQTGGWEALEAEGVEVHRRWRRPGSLKNRLANKLNPSAHFFDPVAQAGAWLDTFRPDLVYISQGSNVDATPYMTLCRDRRIPYSVGIHATSWSIWPDDRALASLREGYAQAQMVWADSRLGLEMTETITGARLPRKATFFNPPLLDPAAPSPLFPEPTNGVWRMACVARLLGPAKGQDILLRALADPEWSERNWILTLVGDGPHENTLKNLAAMLGIAERVNFAGRGSDMRAVWAEHHLCVMTSRYEGLPIALTEALYCARPAVVTRETGGEDVIREGIDGFIAPFAEVEPVRAALNRAWKRRADWQSMGVSARNHLIDLSPADPAAWFADRLLELTESTRASFSS